MVVTAITALAALVSLFRSSGDFDLNVSLSTVSMVVARCYQVYSSAQAEKSDMVQEMVRPARSWWRWRWWQGTGAEAMVHEEVVRRSAPPPPIKSAALSACQMSVAQSNT
eukprot:277786-Chlamydomonas_euryale.AAC.1